MSLNILLILGVVGISNGVHLAHTGSDILAVGMGYLLILVGAISLTWFRQGVDS